MDRILTVPCQPFELRLSHWDRIYPAGHSKRILCFSLPPQHDKEQLVRYLHTAFQRTVKRVPFLAGSIVPFPPDQGGRPWLRNLVPEGAAHLVIKDLSSELSWSELVKANFSQHLLDTDQLCPLPKAAYVQDDPVDVCQFQANFIEGGLLLVVSIVHIAADGRGVTEIINIFAEQLRKAQLDSGNEPLQAGNDVVYRSDRMALVSGNGVPGTLENHGAWTSDAVNSHAQIADVPNSCRMFCITAGGLAKLKQLAAKASTGPDEWLSTNDVISAFIWRSIMVARNRAGILPTDGTSSVVQPIDCRAHLGLPQPFFGNALYMTKSSLSLQKLADPERGLVEAARLLRSAIQSVNADKFRDLVGYATRTELESGIRLNIYEELPIGGIILTSHFKFDLHGLDFGPAFSQDGNGHMQTLRLPAQGTQAGIVIIMPKLTDGSCEFMVTESDSTLSALERDDEFKKYTDARYIVSVPEVQSVAEATALTNRDVPSLVDNITAQHPVDGDQKMSFVKITEIPTPSPSQSMPSVRVRQTICVNDVEATHMGIIRIINLNRPKAKNALSSQMLQELSDEIKEIHTDSGQIRALIIASAADDVFCAGADLKERKTMSRSETQAFLGTMRDVFSRLETIPMPSIACLSGLALGGGLELALCCHMRIFSSNAVVGLPETRLGIIPGAGGTYRLPKIVGSAVAHDLILTGRMMSAGEAYTRGLCTRFVAGSEDELPALSAAEKRALTLDAGIALAKEITGGGPVAIRAAVGALSYSCEAVENASYEVVLRTKDRSEALKAFAEKRSPVFTGE
ncbi:putative enoyl-CoA hydratase/isomerase family protein [Xylaria bambusicola]|uniref:putative enoyl-CoA hydratase/isomerase family protein n=1 Tax=Xylaria bambusicola TaxID=326684 RepID=UPI002007BBB0|nr:putative enoyl-CoA hydratase/isomerase family protein [Xylaria bambusicola]KAI0508952.1 putative enoyl-CoA hydratase/isomerase family protein [Xylaria bambusicola]